MLRDRLVEHGPKVRAVVFYAVVSDEIQPVIEFFASLLRPKAMLARVLGDEPDWRGLPHVE